jgi:hypothetical protein
MGSHDPVRRAQPDLDLYQHTSLVDPVIRDIWELELLLPHLDRTSGNALQQRGRPGLIRRPGYCCRAVLHRG